MRTILKYYFQKAWIFAIGQSGKQSPWINFWLYYLHLTSLLIFLNFGFILFKIGIMLTTIHCGRNLKKFKVIHLLTGYNYQLRKKKKIVLLILKSLNIDLRHGNDIQRSFWWWSYSVTFSSVQFSHSVVSNSLWPHELQHTRSPCPSPTPGVHPNSCPSSWWCHPAISSSVIPFSSSCSQSLPASGFSNESTLRMRWPKYWSFSFSIIPMKIKK